jgi:hypothetical protein
MRAAPMGFGRCQRGGPEGMEPHGPHRRHEAYMRNRKTNVNKPPEAAKPAWSRPPKRHGLRTAAQGKFDWGKRVAPKQTDPVRIFRLVSHCQIGQDYSRAF